MHEPFMPGQAYRSLGYDYQLPSRGYTVDQGWNGWDLATAHYGGNGRGRALERDWFDTIVNRVGAYFSTRRMSESQAREAHQRVYHFQEPERMGYAEISSNTLGGAAAFEAFLLWDRDYHGIYEAMPVRDNRDRLVSMAVGEVYALWDRLGLQPFHAKPNRTLSLQDAAETAAATAKNLFDHHYMRDESSRHRRARSSSTDSNGRSYYSRSTHRRRDKSHSRHHSHSGHSHNGHSHSGYSHHDHHHRQHVDMAAAAALDHSREREAAYRGATAGPGMTAGMIPPGMGHRPPAMAMGPFGGGGGVPMVPGMQQGPMGNPMNPAMMGMTPMMGGMGGQYMQSGMMPGMPGMMPGIMGSGAIAHPGHSSVMYYGNTTGQMMENQMMAQHQAMHGQALPGMSPDYAHRLDGEGPVPGTRQYADAIGYSAAQGMYGAGMYPGGQGYGYPRGSWYGRG
ncbi:hypothetical protein NCC49_002069 [Naganishia albida]|nr:hypothetical protein NCC49_002069 [Naganishia albida]